MWSWSRPKKSPTPAADAERFHLEVDACVRALNGKVLGLTDRYSVSALSVALAVHINVALRACIDRRDITEEQARELARGLIDPRFTSANLERSFQAQAALRGSGSKIP